ncbi:hypothetical protein OESDEN_10077 [Oesophagostomum dentatum]|uniref:Uncharacterized protein n=1 Tax=Oesophagostomum dentatum TaxID=61180 RepID=A0A0B1T1R1_OESDE|nr:hypothetical protein OESDEN_10077 [Oesophagostomum dentatum]
MIDYTIFECEIEAKPIYEKEMPSPSSQNSPVSNNRDQILQSIRRHLEQVYEADRVLLWKMTHCTAYTQMTEIMAGLALVRKLECAIQRRLFEHLQVPSSP